MGVLEIIAIVIGGGTVGSFSLKKVRQFVVKFCRAIVLIDEQMRPNGGSSMYDRLERIEQKIDEK